MSRARVSVRAITREPQASACGDGGPGASEERSARSARAPHGPPGSIEPHRLLALRADGEERDPGVDERCQALDVPTRTRRELARRSRAAEGLPPARQVLVHGR